MLTTNDVARVYDTILSSPGINETVKIDLKLSRKNALLLNAAIECGLSPKDASRRSPRQPEESHHELRNISNECLRKAGLIELSGKVKTFNIK